MKHFIQTKKTTQPLYIERWLKFQRSVNKSKNSSKLEKEWPPKAAIQSERVPTGSYYFILFIKYFTIAKNHEFHFKWLTRIWMPASIAMKQSENLYFHVLGFLFSKFRQTQTCEGYHLFTKLD